MSKEYKHQKQSYLKHQEKIKIIQTKFDDVSSRFHKAMDQINVIKNHYENEFSTKDQDSKKSTMEELKVIADQAS